MNHAKVVHYYQDLIKLFNAIFLPRFNTQLMSGQQEPLYLPKNKNNNLDCHTIFFANDFFSSALHECAHWFIAGAHRRLLEDYGYWYLPDGRSVEQQLLFQQVEIKPQALELLFSLAANYRFHFSLDNLNGDSTDCLVFKKTVYEQARQYLGHGLPKRAQLFFSALCKFYHNNQENVSWQLNVLYQCDFPGCSLEINPKEPTLLD